MKRLKIIFGFLLILGAGGEYINASRELENPFNPGVLLGVIATLFFSSWLIGSGFSKEKISFKSLTFLKYVMISFVLFVISAFFTLSSYIVPSNFVTINGLKVPLGKCIDGNKRIIPDKKQREDYCTCYVEKITNDSILKETYKQQLEDDRLAVVFKKIESSSKFIELGIQDCMSSVTMKWTNTIATSMKKNWKQRLAGTDFELTHDIDTYCDCMINAYREFPLDVIMQEDFAQSETELTIETKCTKDSKK